MKGIALRALVTAIAATLAAAASAQDPRYQYRLEVRVKPGMTAQYEEYGKKIVEAAKKVQAQQWLGFQITAGGRGGVYAFVLPFEKWADRDSWISPAQMLVRAFGEVEGMKIASAGQALTESSESVISELQRDLSTKLDPSSGVAANYLVSRSHVKPDKVADFRLALSKIRAAEAKAPASPSRIARRVIEGDRFLFSTATPFASGAARDQWPAFQEFMGAAYSDSEIRQILATLNGATESSQWYEAVFRPDLSHYTGPTSTN